MLLLLGSVVTATPTDAAGLIEWLLTPISGATEHLVPVSVAWHGRLMVFTWALLMPAAVIVARYFKITPRQRWPQRLDNPFWFITHRRLGYLVTVLTLVGLSFILARRGGEYAPWRSFHTSLGWIVIAFAIFQLVGSLARGTHGGPVNPFTRQRRPPEEWPGDHFSMTGRRIVFEYSHKAIGYVLIPMAVVAVETGLREADAPIWMWLVIALWWLLCAIVFFSLQLVVGCIDTYQAIWGLDQSLPGYRRRPIGMGITRLADSETAKAPWQRWGLRK